MYSLTVSALCFFFSPTGASTCWIASQNGHIHILEYLIHETHLAPSFLELALTSDGATAALAAAQNEHLDVLRFLITHAPSKGHFLETANRNGVTPAFIAAQHNKCRALEFIVQHAPSGAKVLEVARNNGATPALIAAFEGHVEALQYVVEHAPSGKQAVLNNKTNVWGKRPQDWAHEKGFTNVVEYIQGVLHERHNNNSAALLSVAQPPPISLQQPSPRIKPAASTASTGNERAPAPPELPLPPPLTLDVETTIVLVEDVERALVMQDLREVGIEIVDSSRIKFGVEIGGGSSGRVYAAVYRMKNVAVKILPIADSSLRDLKQECLFLGPLRFVIQSANVRLLTSLPISTDTSTLSPWSAHALNQNSSQSSSSTHRPRWMNGFAIDLKRRKQSCV